MPIRKTYSFHAGLDCHKVRFYDWRVLFFLNVFKCVVSREGSISHYLFIFYMVVVDRGL